MIVIIICAASVFYYVSKGMLERTFTDLETRETQQNVDRVISALDNERNLLNAANGDWAAWDDTYAFVRDRNPQYLMNFSTDALAQQQLNAVLIVDQQGRIIAEKGFNLQQNKETSVPSSLKEHFKSDSDLLNFTSTEDICSGIIILPEGAMLVSARPILTSTYNGPIGGTMIMGRFLDSFETDRIAQLTHIKFTFTSPSQTDMSKELQLSLLQGQSLVKPIDNDNVMGYKIIKDIYGAPAILLKVVHSRETYNKGMSFLNLFIIAVLIIALVAGTAGHYVMTRIVFRRIGKLVDGIDEVRETQDLSLRMPEGKNDEISFLAIQINAMLNAMEKSHLELSNSEIRYRAIVEDQTEMIFRFSPGGTVTFVNEALTRLANKSVQELIGANIFTEIMFDNREAFEKSLKKLDSNNPTLSLEHPVTLTGQTPCWHQWTIRAVFDEQAHFMEYQAVGRDISERKRAEDQLQFLSMHDPLTGLYNRVYFEQAMKQPGSDRVYPLGMIVCDLDGLKLVNDTLGHNWGDVLLKAASRVLNGSVRKGDIVARIGGDEFGIILPNCDRRSAEDICNKINQAMNEFNLTESTLVLSISKGFAVSHDLSISCSDLYREADHNMYREKLQNSGQVRTAIFTSLMSELKDRDFLNDGHAERISKLVSRLAAAAGLTIPFTVDLHLLSNFHDIGKVGISKDIIFKPGPLLPEETLEMQHHTEIGYRIALLAPELTSIADWILKHHEWWNGEGYPLGLKGADIPIECRMLAIADAYDAMTSDRPYRKAMIPEQARAEIIKGAGTQFDPDLVTVFLSNLHT